MKPTMYENLQMKSDLLDVAVTRENIGEALWYIYTGILIISYTSYKITSSSCPPDMNQVIKKKATSVANKVSNTATNVAAPEVVGAANKVSNTATNVVAPGVVGAANKVSNTATNVVAPAAVTNTLASTATKL